MLMLVVPPTFMVTAKSLKNNSVKNVKCSPSSQIFIRKNIFGHGTTGIKSCLESLIYVLYIFLQLLHDMGSAV